MHVLIDVILYNMVVVQNFKPMLIHLCIISDKFLYLEKVSNIENNKISQTYKKSLIFL